jgi:hypothetical protein
MIRSVLARKRPALPGTSAAGAAMAAPQTTGPPVYTTKRAADITVMPGRHHEPCRGALDAIPAADNAAGRPGLNGVHPRASERQVLHLEHTGPAWGRLPHMGRRPLSSGSA